MPRIRRLHNDKTLAVGYRRASARAYPLVEYMLDRAQLLAEAGDYKGASDCTRAAQQASVAGGVALDKARISEERPTQITKRDEPRDAEDIIASLQRLAPQVFTVIDGDATEIQSTPGRPSCRRPHDPLH